MILCAEVAGYELVLAETPNRHWSVSLRGAGHFLTPLLKVYESVDDAKRYACQWATSEAGMPCPDELLEQTCWRQCRGY
jgi:hypothetical protein